MTIMMMMMMMIVIIIIIIISTCPILAKEQYIKRHDRVCAQLHFNICKETGVQLDKKHCYEHVPKSVETSRGKVTILWNQQVQTNNYPQQQTRHYNS